MELDRVVMVRALGAADRAQPSSGACHPGNEMAVVGEADGEIHPHLHPACDPLHDTDDVGVVATLVAP